MATTMANFIKAPENFEMGTDVEDFIKETERFFELMSIAEDFKVRFVKAFYQQMQLRNIIQPTRIKIIWKD